jgi:hypothetical protein
VTGACVRVLGSRGGPDTWFLPGHPGCFAHVIGCTGSGLSGRSQGAGRLRVRPESQAGLICLASWLVISTLRGFAASLTGMARVSTPAV